MCPASAGRLDADDPIEQDMPIAFKEPSMTESTLRIRGQVVIIDPHGLHMRPAARLAVLAKSFRSEIRVIAKGTTADAKSLLELVILAIECGTTLDLDAHGPDAEEAVAALSGLIVAGLDGSVGRGVAAA
jgi:phosphocarrier protein HPr